LASVGVFDLDLDLEGGVVGATNPQRYDDEGHQPFKPLEGHIGLLPRLIFRPQSSISINKSAWNFPELEKISQQTR
jgi:hypothetical protein